MLRLRSILLLACLTGMFSARAQRTIVRDSTIQNQTIEIRQDYEPEIERPEKPQLTPSLPKIDAVRPEFRYEVPQQTLRYTYNSVPIRPLALGKQQPMTGFENFFKAGFGNLRSLLVDAGVGALYDEDYATTFRFFHHSQKGQLLHQQSSRTFFDADGTYYTTAHELGGKLRVKHNRNRFYGYDKVAYDYDDAELRQAFTGARIELGLKNSRANAIGIDYHPELELGIYSDRHQAIERSLNLELPVRRRLSRAVTLSLGLEASLTQFKNRELLQGNSYFQLNPAVDFEFTKTAVRLGLSPAFGQGGRAYLLPDLYLKTALADRHLGLMAGWKAELMQNTFEALSDKNPFINNLYRVRQGRSDHFFAGFESGVGAHFSFGGIAGFRQWTNLPLMVNDYASHPDGKQFAVVYDEKVQALNLEAFAHYQVGSVFGVSVNGSWNNFVKTTTFEKAWHEPMLRLNATLELRPLERLFLTAGLNYWDGMYARQANGEPLKLPAFLDLNAAAEFNVIKNLSVFLQLNNILGKEYTYWYQYPVYGFNILGGLRFKF